MGIFHLNETIFSYTVVKFLGADIFSHYLQAEN